MKKLLILGMVLLLVIPIVFATVERGRPFLELDSRSYGPSQLLTGYLNFSLINQNGNTKIISTIGDLRKELSILEFLGNTPGSSYKCTPTNCEEYYTKQESIPRTEKTFLPGEYLIGIRITGTEVVVNDLEFVIEGSGGDSMCWDSQVKLDILDDSITDWEYKEGDDSVVCGISNGDCFDSSSYESAKISGSKPYCERVILDKTGMVEVTANLKCSEDTCFEADSDDLKLYIYDTVKSKAWDCLIEDFVDDNEFNEYSCLIYGEDFFVDSEREFYACIKQVKNANVEYYIKAEGEGEVCGFYDIPSANPTFTRDFDFQVKQYAFLTFGDSAIFNSTTFLGGDLTEYLQNYIIQEYNRNCSQECIIPIYINTSQEIIISDMVLDYTKAGGPTTMDEFYDIQKAFPIINMNMSRLSLTALNITAPTNFATYSLAIDIDSKIGSKTFKVERVPIITSFGPNVVIPGQLTEFTVIASSPKGNNLVSYKWNWGDGSSDTTTATNKASHTYSSPGTYVITVSVKDSEDLTGAQGFQITAGVSKEYLINLVNSKIEGLGDYKDAFDSLEAWYEDLFESNISSLNASLNSILLGLGESLTETQLVQIKNELDYLTIPIGIENSEVVRESQYFVDVDSIELEDLQDLGAGSFDDEDQYRNAISVWQDEKVDLYFSYVIKGIRYNPLEDKATIIELKLDPKVSLDDVYIVFILPSGVNPRDIKVKGEYEETTNGIGFSYPSLSSQKTIEFALPGKQDDLKFYISPKLRELGLDTGDFEVTKPPVVLAVIIGVLILGIVVFVILWIWKGHSVKKTEDAFANPNDLFAITNYIQSGLANRVSKEQIKQELESSGWKKNQIDYAFKNLGK
ncbi:MAG: PKD domain-containing protein [archaeon]